VELASVDGDNDSRLNVFRLKNPFKSQLKHPSELPTAGFSTAGPSASSPSSSGSSGGGESSGGSSETSSGSGGGSTSGGTSSPSSPTHVAKYTYVVDATLIRGTAVRHITGMTRLTMLPSESSPLLLFLGVDSGADNAVFLVDSTVKASGEGSCNPKPSECALLSLGAGSEERFTDSQGRTYLLRIDQIRQVSLSRVRAARTSAHSARTSAHAGARASAHVAAHATADAGAEASVEPPRFAPLLTDLVIMASDAGDRSNSPRDDR
jgi:hypothetical protein